MQLARGAFFGVLGLGLALAACADSAIDGVDAGADSGASGQPAMHVAAGSGGAQHSGGSGGGSGANGTGGAGGATPSMPSDAGTHDASTHDAAARDAAVADADLADAADPIDAATTGDTIPIIVAAGANHSLHLSIDEGHTFCQVQRQVPADIGDGYDNAHLFRHITFANHHFVTGSWKVVLASTNGYAWTDVTDGDTPALGNWVAEIDFGNGYWVGVGGNGGVMRSSDLQHWDHVDVAWGGSAARSLVFGDGKFVASRDGMGWWSSTDGAAWTQFDAAQTDGVVFDGGEFIADPGYRRARGIRLRSGGGGIQRADDSDGAAYTTVATVQDGVADIAFGEAPAEDYASGKVMPESLATCLGL